MSPRLLHAQSPELEERIGSLQQENDALREHNRSLLQELKALEALRARLLSRYSD
jgi:regulator of replication initiation timing